MTQWFTPIIAVSTILSAAYLSGIALSNNIAGAITLVAGTLAWFSPDWAILLLIGLAPLGRSPASQLLPFQVFSETKVLAILIVVFIWAIRNVVVKPTCPFPRWLNVVLAGWISLAFLSLLHSQDPAGSTPHLMACLAAVVFFFTIWNSDNRLYHKIACAALASALGITVLSLLQYMVLKYRILTPIWNFILAPRERLFMQIDWSPMGDHFYRVSGSFPHPNALGVYYYLVIPFVAASMTLGVFGKWQRRTMAIIFFLMLIGLYTANCRAGVVAIGISLAYLSVHRGCRWLIGVAAAVLLASGLIYLKDPDGFSEYFQTVGRTEHGISSRGTIWGNGHDLFSRNMWLGVGPGQFVSHYNADFGLFIFDNPKEIFEQSFLLQTEREDLINGYHAHNTPLQLICEYGIFALPLFLFGIVGVIVASEKRALTLPVGSFGRAMALGSASFCTSYLVGSIFDSYVTFTTVGLVFLGAPLVAIGLRSV